MLFNSKRYLIACLLLFSISANANSISINGGGYRGWESTEPTAADLPVSGNVDGDAKIVLDTKGLYAFDLVSGNWLLIASPAAATAITALIGDVHCTGPGACVSTIQPNVVSNTKLAQMAAMTIKGNSTAGAADPQDLAVSSVNTMLGDELLANKAINLTSPNNMTYPTTQAVSTAIGSIITGVLPSGVIPTEGNKIDFRFGSDGYFIQSFNMPAATAGAYNGGGTGNKALIGFSNYNSLPFSSMTGVSFTARSIRDELAPSVQGMVYWNMLANFNSGALSAANDYVNMEDDGLGVGNLTKYFILTNSQATYNLNFSTNREWKCVGCTGSIDVTATCTNGNNFVTGVTNTSALTVGMYFKRDPQGSQASIPEVPLPDGTTIIGINLDGANTVRVSNNCNSTVGPVTFKQYGGVAPVSRSGTCNGTTTISGITNTADLQNNMLVNDGGTLIPAHSFIVSMVANTSITLNNSCASGTPTINFVAAGKTGIPSNAQNVGVSWNTVKALNPNAFFWNGAPTVAGGWAAADGGFPKNSVQSSFNFVQGSSGTTDARINSLQSVTINSDVYTFGH